MFSKEFQLQTESVAIRSLVTDIVTSANEIFGCQCKAVYIMGSLARGGFSEIASDIDIGVILSEPLSDVSSKIDKIKDTSLEKYPLVHNSVSIFWGSIESINGLVDIGRYPPFDRLDLIDHALLVSGQDIRDKLVKPSKRELEIASVEFSLDYLGTQKRQEEFSHCNRIAEKGAVYVTKTILFPARFIYLAQTGKIAGNDMSYKNYMANFSGADADLVEQGYMWRNEPLPTDLNVVTTALDKGLVPLYSRFINVYSDIMGQYGEGQLKRNLLQWKRNITV
jgi:predicted nucleotidyltransferase